MNRNKKPTLESVKWEFPDAVEARGKVWLAGRTVDRILDGVPRVPLSFTRRRYSNATFTWVDFYLDGKWTSSGDPWPCVTPSAKDLRTTLNLLISRNQP